MLSFWEIQSFVNCDYLIIGGGIVGLSTAIGIKEKRPNQIVYVLERGILPSGASTKNAGFACFGSVSELLDDLKKMSPQEVADLVLLRWEGLQLLRQRLGDNTIEFAPKGGYELIFQGQEHILEGIAQVNELLYPLFKQNVFEQKDELIHEFGFNKDKVKHLVYNKFEGGLHTGKMMKALWHKAQQMGIHIFTGTQAMHYEETEKGVQVAVKSGGSQEEMQFVCQKLAICTNAFTKQFFPDLDLQPGRGQVLVTQAIPNLPFKGVFHYDEGYYYFRNYQNRIIFGGGRNLDFEGETTTKMQTTPQIIEELKNQLFDLILPKQNVQIDHQWAGIMAFGQTKQPLVEYITNNVYIGARLGGMGVAIGSMLGEQLAQKIV